MKKIILGLLLSCCYPIFATNGQEEIFTAIYENEVWGKGAGSGGGSHIENALPYVHFLQNFLKEKNIASVVDVGCGDWQFSQYINWSGIHYTGYEVVKFLVDKNQTVFGSPSIQFVHADGIHMDLPQADLVLCKDVLQHLSNEDVWSFLSQLGNFKYCLITNDVDVNSLPLFANQDTYSGGYRPLDITKPPFNVKAIRIFHYFSQGVFKQVLLIENKNL